MSRRRALSSATREIKPRTLRMQDGELFVTDGVRFSTNRLSTLPGAGGRAGVFACPPQQRQLQERDDSPMTGKGVGGGGLVEAQDVIPSRTSVRQPRRTVRATEMLRRQRTRVCGLSNPYCNKKSNSARSSVAGPSRPLLTRAPGCHSAGAGVAMSRIRGWTKGKDTNIR